MKESLRQEIKDIFRIPKKKKEYYLNELVKLIEKQVILGQIETIKYVERTIGINGTPLVNRLAELNKKLEEIG